MSNTIFPTSTEKYSKFLTYCSLSWDSKPRMVHNFTHTLTQYTPSCFAELAVVYPKSEINNFLKIEQIPIISRALNVSCITDGFGPNVIYDRYDNTKLFGGPWRLICNNYTINPMPPSTFAIEGDPKPTESYLVVMQCVDRVWYSMTQEEKVGVFSTKKYKSISDCVKYILDLHKARSSEIENSTTEFNWLQSKMTDYEFIRSVLAYTNPPGFHFYCNNEVGYFKTIGSAGCYNGEINIDIRGLETNNIVSIINKHFLEKISDGPIIIPYGEGLNDSEHQERDAAPMGGSGLSSGGKRYIKFSIDNEAIKQAFSANVNFRTRMFGRVVKLKTVLMTDITPLHTIKVANNAPDKYPTVCSGEYYVVSVKNVIGVNSNTPFVPHTYLVLSRGGE